MARNPEARGADIAINRGEAYDLEWRFFDDDAQTIPSNLTGGSYQVILVTARGREMRSTVGGTLSGPLSEGRVVYALTEIETLRLLPGSASLVELWDIGASELVSWHVVSRYDTERGDMLNG